MGKCDLLLVSLCITIVTLAQEVNGSIPERRQEGGDTDVIILPLEEAMATYRLNETDVVKRALPIGGVAAYVLMATCEYVTFWIIDLSMEYADGWLDIKVYLDGEAIPRKWTKVYKHPTFAFLDFPTFAVTFGPYDPCTKVFIESRLKKSRGKKRLGTFSMNTDCPCEPGIGEGDPHYVNYDGYHIDFNGECYYIITTSACGDTPEVFTVIARHGDIVNPAFNPVGRRIDSALISTNNHDVNVTNDGTVEIDGVIINGSGMTTDLDAGVQILNNATHIVFSITKQWWIEWEKNPRGNRNRLFIGIHEDSPLIGNLCGLIGNKLSEEDQAKANAEVFKGFVKRDGSLTFDIEELGNSWVVPESCPPD